MPDADNVYCGKRFVADYGGTIRRVSPSAGSLGSRDVTIAAVAESSTSLLSAMVGGPGVLYWR
jgi:hypothetical protein